MENKLLNYKQSAARHEAGFLYIAANHPLYKIGVTFFPEKRLKQIRSTAYPPYQIWSNISGWRLGNTRLFHVIPVSNMAVAEMFVWDRLEGRRCISSEWFWLTSADLEWLQSLTEITV